MMDRITADTSTGLWLGAYSLWRREMVRFLRQRSRVIGALLTPLLFWFVLGSGLGRSFSPTGPGEQSAGFLEYFFPGMVMMILLFTAIFSSFSIIEDRREGFFQAVLSAPIPRLAIVLGKVLGGATLATLQGALVLPLWFVVYDSARLGPLAAAVGIIFVISISLMALCLCLAWRMDSTAGFHVVMNLLLMPMWFLCGAVFPISGAGRVIGVLMLVNPLTYGQALLRSAMAGDVLTPVTPIPQWLVVTVTVGFAGAIVLWAGHVVSKPRKDGT